MPFTELLCMSSKKSLSIFYKLCPWFNELWFTEVGFCEQEFMNQVGLLTDKTGINSFEYVGTEYFKLD